MFVPSTFMLRYILIGRVDDLKMFSSSGYVKLKNVM